MSITSIVEYFYSLLSHPDTFNIARKQPNYFIRESKLGLPGLLKFMFSRNGHTVSNEINHYFLDLTLWINQFQNRQYFRHRKNSVIKYFHILTISYASIIIIIMNMIQLKDIPLLPLTVLPVKHLIRLNVLKHLAIKVCINISREEQIQEYLDFMIYAMASISIYLSNHIEKLNSQWLMNRWMMFINYWTNKKGCFWRIGIMMQVICFSILK